MPFSHQPWFMLSFRRQSLKKAPILENESKQASASTQGQELVAQYPSLLKGKPSLRAKASPNAGRDVSAEGAPRLPVDFDDVYRGLAVHRLLANIPNMLDTVQPDAVLSKDYHELSMKLHGTQPLHDFLSHSWRTPPLKKWCALVFQYNATPAAFFAVLAGVAALCVQVALRHMREELVPKINTGTPGRVHYIAGFCSVCGSFVGIVLLFGDFVARFWYPRDFHVFFDKACIDQFDEDRRLAGIKSIGQFLQRSVRLVLLWDDDYFERLWCAFECAAFLRATQQLVDHDATESSQSVRHHQNGGDEKTVLAKFFTKVKTSFGGVTNPEKKVIQMAPVFLGVFAVSMYVLNSLIMLVLIYVMHVADNNGIVDANHLLSYYVFWGVVTNMFWIPKFYFCSRSIKARRAMISQIDQFSVVEAKCGNESDRSTIYEVIRDCFGTFEGFNQVLRRQLRLLAEQEMGVGGNTNKMLPLSAVRFEQLAVWLFMLDCLVWVDTLSDAWRVFVVFGGLALVWDPLFLHGLHRITSMSADIQGGCWWLKGLTGVALQALGLSCAAWLHLMNIAPLFLATFCLLVGYMLVLQIYL
eukprot:TRINITY_DN40021_c0_g1_i1.p1 TRINITY_DN40021_c0_g1~~TRINITY_DN40021_c0_g1_i1.p1  ORF type:complete len:584 (+),score=86.83 TRINITY_DN40021_c0_g1_i1:63-1814(+)